MIIYSSWHVSHVLILLEVLRADSSPFVVLVLGTEFGDILELVRTHNYTCYCFARYAFLCHCLRISHGNSGWKVEALLIHQFPAAETG